MYMCVWFCMYACVSVSLVHRLHSQWGLAAVWGAGGWPERVKADNQGEFHDAHTSCSLQLYSRKNENKTHIWDVFSPNQFLHIKHTEEISSTALVDLEISGREEEMIHQERLMHLFDGRNQIFKDTVYLWVWCMFLQTESRRFKSLRRNYSYRRL